MPINSGFYNSVNGDRVYDADQFGSLFDGIISDGVFPNVGDKFFVRPIANSMNIFVGSGKAWLNRRWVENTGDETLAVQAANATLDRIDSVVLSVDISKAVRGAKLEIIKGTASATPNPPLIPSDGEKKYMILANIRVVKNARAIGAESITNFVGSSLTPYVSGPVSTINLNSLQAKLQGEFDNWFQTVRDALQNAGGNTSTDVANLKASDNAQNTKISQLETRAGQIESSVTNVSSKLNTSSTFYDMVNISHFGMHNSVYRGASLGTNVSNYMSNIRNGTFSGMYLGDYWTYAGINWRIVAFNYFYGVGGTPIQQHHVVVVPDKALYSAPLHETNPFTGSYLDHTINKSGLDQAVRMAQSAFGANNLMKGWTRVSQGINTNGTVISYTWYSSYAMLLDETMVFGRRLMGAGPEGNALNLGQLPAFERNHTMIFPGYEYWLRDRSHQSTAVYLKSNGEVSTAPIQYGIGIRPYFLIG